MTTTKSTHFTYQAIKGLVLLETSYELSGKVTETSSENMPLNLPTSVLFFAGIRLNFLHINPYSATF